MTRTLALQGVEVALGGRSVLHGLELVVEPGQVVLAAGPNGAGKTTLLRVAAGLLRPDRGRVRLDGRPLESWSRRELARELALVPQETRVPFPFRVDEVVLMGRMPHRTRFGFESAEDRRQAHAALERLGLLELAARSVLELSGGERQLVMVARALAQNPAILLLDEATAHLDLARRLELVALLRGWAEQGRSALVVSHDLALSPRAADRVVLLAEGRIVAEGPPTEALRPESLRRVFGVEAELVPGPDGPIVVARRALPRGVTARLVRAAPGRDRPPGARCPGA